jgi:ABC-type lipoprotein export system ATPase subunit
MMKLGGPSNEQKQAIHDLSVLFDGDNDALLKAVRAYAEQKATSKPRTPKRDMSKAETLLEIVNVSKTYKIGRQKLEVLKGVSLSIKKGEFVAITGASGSGKSTLLQLLGGLDTPSNGDILFDGANLAKMSDARLSDFRRDTIGFVFQFFYLQPFLRLEKNLEVPGMFARTKKAARREQVLELANTVGLGDRLQHYPKELSGGQMQRAAIARALLNTPKILLADEPTGNLDSVNGKAIIELFERIRDEFGMTIVIVTHDAEIAARADREIILKDGVML